MSKSGSDWEVTGTQESVWPAWKQYMEWDDLAPIWERLGETGKILPGHPVIPGQSGQH